MHIACKKLIWTLNIIFLQVYPCDKYLQSQILEWKCFIHFSVKEFLHNIYFSVIDIWFRTPFRDSVSSFEIQYFTAAIFAIKMCISIQKIFFSVKQQLCLYCKRNPINSCFTGICYQRNYGQHTKVRSVGSNSLWQETCKVM